MEDPYRGCKLTPCVSQAVAGASLFLFWFMSMAALCGTSYSLPPFEIPTAAVS